MNNVNSVTISGLIHHLSKKKNSSYFPFSIRHENSWTDGSTRKDFLNARAFRDDHREFLAGLDENTPVIVKGILRSSKGSGELFLDVTEAKTLPELGEVVNSVELSGAFHVIKAQNEGVTGIGKYTRFAVKQEDPVNGKDFIVVRVYDEAMRNFLAGKNDNDPVNVHGTLRSSRGSGVNYVMCGKLE
ncbi:MAG: OB-fold nucleic acid binding domain-containing protein [Synergistaceae bacterium]|nr:OB-fold nucleic acid binding domain-containing protein [Synergistaceae bacterium]